MTRVTVFQRKTRESNDCFMKESQSRWGWKIKLKINTDKTTNLERKGKIVDEVQLYREYNGKERKKEI